MNTPKISVIIPLYNAEKFIRQCLISVLASKFQDYEVIVVDDCSTDNSLAEVKKIQPHFDGRLKILSTEKNSGGAGIPRNVGIKNSSGKYVTFVDNDDMILPIALEKFFEIAEQFQADVIHTDKAFTLNGTDGKNSSLADMKLQSETSDEFLQTPKLVTKDLRERMKDYVAEKYFWLPWGKFFRRDFLLENKINFPQMQYSEDMVFCFKCLCLAKNYLRVPFATNIHHVRKNSASKNSLIARDIIKRHLSVITIGVAAINKFMSKQKFFTDNPDVQYDVLKFFITKHFSFINFGNISAHEVQKIFLDELQNPALDSNGKNLVVAYLFAENIKSQ